MVTRKLLILAIVAVLAACGSKASPPEAPAEPPAEAPAETPAPETEATEAAAPAAAEPAAPAAPDPAQIKAELVAAEQAAFEAAKPVFEKNCFRCHQQGNRKAKKSILGEFDMTAYPFTGDHGHDAGKTVRKVLAIGGGRPTMPADKRGAVKGDDLALIAAWADAFDRAHEGGAHEDRAGHAHD